MFELLRAEWIKVVGHRRPLVYLVGIFPLGAALIFFCACLLAAFEPSFKDTTELYLSNWSDLMLKAWLIPNHALGRVFLLGFTALVFAGEYQWGTWKNITPRRRRSVLVLVKLCVVSALVLSAFVLTSLIMAVGGSVASTLAGVDPGPTFGVESIRALIPDYLLAVTIAFLTFLITASIASIAAIYSRSILGGSLTGVFLIFAEPLSLLVPRWLAGLLEMPGLLHLQRGTPMYNLDNLRSWIHSGEASLMLDDGFLASGLAVPGDGTVFSVLVVAGWILLGVSGVLMIFERQDITT